MNKNNHNKEADNLSIFEKFCNLFDRTTSFDDHLDPNGAKPIEICPSCNKVKCADGKWTLSNIKTETLHISLFKHVLCDKCRKSFLKKIISNKEKHHPSLLSLYQPQGKTH